VQLKEALCKPVLLVSSGQTEFFGWLAAKVESMASSDDTQSAGGNLEHTPSLFFFIIAALVSSVALEAIFLSLG